MIAVVARDFETFRERARALLEAHVHPEDVSWGDGCQRSLFDAPALVAAEVAARPAVDAAAPRVPADFVRRARDACDHADPDRFAVLYRLLWKLTHGARGVLDDPLDEDAARLAAMQRELREEEHRMHAFVRFGRTEADRWVAWYRPAHPILARVAPFFARRYPAMCWTIFTPTQSAHWDGARIQLGPGAPRESAPALDELDALFLAYYASVFNPARTNREGLQRHLPLRVRAQLPEARVIEGLARGAAGRVEAMRTERASASAALLPVQRDLESLSRSACACRACPIGERATQTVFGEGPRDARLMVVGEQPGDEEDRAGRPFVGPAGRLFDALLAEAGLPRSQLYVTNAVKHFKWEPRGKVRLHSKPKLSEIDACRAWLLAEVEALRPAMILCLGATAAQSFCGPGFRVQRDRGRPTRTPWAPWWMATYHPSAVLRAEAGESARSVREALLADLRCARDHWQSLAASAAAVEAHPGGPT